jgi:hypothetical protein
MECFVTITNESHTHFTSTSFDYHHRYNDQSREEYPNFDNSTSSDDDLLFK